MWRSWTFLNLLITPFEVVTQCLNWLTNVTSVNLKSFYTIDEKIFSIRKSAPTRFLIIFCRLSQILKFLKYDLSGKNFTQTSQSTSLKSYFHNKIISLKHASDISHRRTRFGNGFVICLLKFNNAFKSIESNLEI